MGKYLNPDNEKFKTIIYSGMYMDKTGLIKHLNARISGIKKYAAFMRPGRFGKSTDAEMLNAYYSKGCDSKELFQGLEIAGDPSFETYLNKYDVIKINIREMRSNYLSQKKKGFNSAVQYIRNEVLYEVKSAYSDCVDPNVQTLSEALMQCNLSNEKIQFIIIDEWDCFFRKDKNDFALLEKYMYFLRTLFKGEVQIVLKPMKNDGQRTLIGHVLENELILLDFIGPRENIRFKEYKH